MALLTALTNTIAVDNTGKLPVGLIPDSVTGALNYQGTWNAATNTPTLANGTGTKGHYYKVAVQGTFNIGGIDFWNLGDIISYNGSTWDRIDGGINEVVEGPQGPTGPAGPMGQTGGPGPAGQTLYTWFAYADNATGTVNFTNGAWTNQTYLGIAVNKTTPTESTNPADYTWSKMQGPPGAQGTTGSAGAAGPQGDSMFTWIAYANSADGTLNFTTGASSGHTYIGIANNKTSAVESTNPTQYVWSKIQGEDGVPGTPGINGETTYTWFAYANNATGTVGFTTGAWTNQTYLGLAVNKLTATESQNPADYTWSKMQGDQGATGPTGAAGPQGNSMYTWIAYANSADGTLNFTTGASSGHTYIGLANNKTSSTESTNPVDYTWSKIQGDAGVPGTPGANGQTTYTWFAYANSADGTSGFTTGAWTNQTYLGLATNKLTSVESTNPADYIWSKIQGPTGAQGATGPTGAAGAQGNSMYTWIAYADNSTGTVGFTTGANTGQAYIGIANNQTSSTESTNPALYTWSKIQGDAGVPGTPGADGAPTYTWFAYANNSTGTVGFTTGAWTNQTYLGLAANKLTSVESTNPADYTWSKIQGNDGPSGPSGQPGTRGSSSFYASGGAWSDATANATVLARFPTGVVVNDEVTISDGSTFAMVKYWNGGAWVAPGQVIDGNLLVTGSVNAAKVNTNGLTIRDPAGNIILDASGGAALDWSKIFGAGRPQDGATVGAAFGTNITGQITAGNVSTYIAAAAIGDAYIGNLSAQKITAGTLSASSYVQVDAGGGNTARMGLLPDSSFGIRGTYNNQENFKLSPSGLSFNPTNATLWKMTGSNIKKTIAEGRVVLTGVANNTVISTSILIPNAANTVYTKVIEVQVVGYWENADVTSTRTIHKKLYIQLAYKNSTGTVLKYDAGVYMCEHSDGTNWPVYTGTTSDSWAYNGAAWFYYDQANEELYLNLKSPASNDIDDESFFSYSIQEYEGKPIVSVWG